MYEAYFGLRRRPFRSTPDSDAYYPATGHEAALQCLLLGIEQDEGLALVTGAPGTGKTLLCHALLERLGSDVTSAFLTNSHVSDRRALLQSILFDLSLPYEGRTEQELRLALTDFLITNYGSGRRTVIVVDEAQHLTSEGLEELRLLGNLETRNGKAVQVVLAAQPTFLDKLLRQELAAFSQRLAVRSVIEPLSVEEAADYLRHQVRAAGGRVEAVFSEEALGLLARGSHGVPRLLNQTAHHALSLAHAGEMGTVDAEVALEALAHFGLEIDEPEAENEEEPLGLDSPPLVVGDDADDLQDDETEVSGGEPALGPAPHLATGRARRLYAAPRRPA